MAGEAGSWSHHIAQARIVEAIARLTWREVESNDTAATAGGPVLLVANHFGGAADAIVLMSVLPRRPRILADDSIWRFPVARQVMEWIGAIPVHRGRGATGGAEHHQPDSTVSGSPVPDNTVPDNTDMFAATHDALAEGELVLIFPEGITREEPSIGKVRSGAARIALGARAAGVEGIRIVPVGIHYDDKAAFRSAVYVREGDPIELDALVEGATAQDPVVDEHAAVDDLTGVVEQRLRDAAPDYDDWREARALQTAAEAYLRDLEPTRSVPIGLRDRLGGWLARRPNHEAIEDEADMYRSALDGAGLTDSWATEGSAGLRWKGVATLVTWLIMVPYALAGVVMNGVPTVMSWAVSKLRLGPAVMATVLPVAAALLFGLNAIAWLVLGWMWDTWAGLFVVVVMLPVSFTALVAVTERALLWRRGMRNRLFGLRHSEDDLIARRGRVVDLVASEIDVALGAGGPAPTVADVAG